MATFKKHYELHPLARYIRNWKAFNAAVRKQNNYFLLGILFFTMFFMVIMMYLFA